MLSIIVCLCGSINKYGHGHDASSLFCLLSLALIMCMEFFFVNPLKFNNMSDITHVSSFSSKPTGPLLVTTFLFHCTSFSVDMIASFNLLFILNRSSFILNYQAKFRNKPVAIKKFQYNEQVKERFLHELKIVRTLDHKNVVKLLGFCFEYSDFLVRIPNGIDNVDYDKTDGIGFMSSYIDKRSMLEVFKKGTVSLNLGSSDFVVDQTFLIKPLTRTFLRMYDFYFVQRRNISSGPLSLGFSKELPRAYFICTGKVFSIWI